MLLIITSTGDELFSGINIDDFEWPQTPKIGCFSVFFVIFGCGAHFKGKLWRNGWRNCWGCRASHDLCSNYLLLTSVPIFTIKNYCCHPISHLLSSNYIKPTMKNKYERDCKLLKVHIQRPLSILAK